LRRQIVLSGRVRDGRVEPGPAGGLQRAGLLLGLGWAAALIAAGIRWLVRVSPPLCRTLWPVLTPAGCYVLRRVRRTVARHQLRLGRGNGVRTSEAGR